MPGSLVVTDPRSHVRQRQIIAPGNAFVVRDFLSPEAVARWRARGEEAGYVANAPISMAQGPTRDDSVRNNSRAMIDRPDWAEALWPQMAPLFEAIDGGEPVGVNERFRFYRYGAGQYFQPHYDGYFQRSATERSLWTVLIYLDGACEGGATVLFAHDHEVTPEAGLLLAFRHRQLHAGQEVVRGLKEVLRTDVMYRFPAV